MALFIVFHQQGKVVPLLNGRLLAKWWDSAREQPLLLLLLGVCCVDVCGNTS